MELRWLEVKNQECVHGNSVEIGKIAVYLPSEGLRMLFFAKGGEIGSFC